MLDADMDPLEPLCGSVLHLTKGSDLFEICVPSDDEEDSDEEKPSPSEKLLSAGKALRGRLRSESEALAEEGEVSVTDLFSTVRLKRSTSFTLVSVRMEKIDSRIFLLDWLTSMTLHGNNLQDLPDAISNLCGLTSLNVTNNKLATLPAGIGHLTCLTRLDISHNHLITLPLEVSHLSNLETCMLDFNKLSEFPPPLCELPSLATLSMKENYNIRCFPSIERLAAFKQLNLQIDNIPTLFDEWQTMSLSNVTLEWHKVYPDRINDFLYIGSLRTAQEQRVYDDLHINRVVTCGLGMSITLGEGMDQLLLALADTVDANLSGHLKKGIEYLKDAKAKDERVLVHCFAGLSRSASLVCAYLMQENEWTFQQSLDYVRKFRPNVCPNDGFVKQLEAFEKELGLSEKQ